MRYEDISKRRLVEILKAQDYLVSAKNDALQAKDATIAALVRGCKVALNFLQYQQYEATGPEYSIKQLQAAIKEATDGS